MPDAKRKDSEGRTKGEISWTSKKGNGGENVPVAAVDNDLWQYLPSVKGYANAMTDPVAQQGPRGPGI